MSLENKVLLDLAAANGTPLYVYDGNLIQQRYREMHSFFPNEHVKIFYAMKANDNTAILQLLKAQGAYLDTVSPGEVHLARAVGFSPDRILFTANNMTGAEMREVHDLGILLNIDSLSGLNKYGKMHPGSNVCLRFNPDVVAGFHDKVQTGGAKTKFGILLEDMDEALRIAAEYHLSIVGVHEHTGSGIDDTAKVYDAMNALLQAATPERFPNLRFVNFGGGFKVPYHPGETQPNYRTFGQEASRIFEEFCGRFGKELLMYFEPGRYIVAESGHLLVEVNTLKNTAERKIAGVNSGFNHLVRPVMYDAYHHIVNLSNPEGFAATYDVVGNICETGDRFAQQREIAEIREGDILDIKNAGAYGYSMGSHYNQRPMPAEVMVLNGNSHLIRKGITGKELAWRQLAQSPGLPDEVLRA